MSRLQIALDLRARGWSVIPLYPKSKQAMIRWTEFQQHLASEEDIRGWFDREPDANIGIVTGGVSGIVVGDVDPRHGGSVEDMQRSAPSGFVVTTPGGGAHFYYLHPGGRSPKSKPRPGIDYQADGCYVVAAGSYVVTDTYEGEYHQLSAGDLTAAPAWLADRPTERSDGAAGTGAGSGEAWVGSALRDGCAPGTRNDTLTRLAGYFATKLPEDITRPILTRWVLSQDNTGVTEDEAARTIAGIYAKEKRNRPAVSGAYVVDEFSEAKKTGPMDSMILSEFGARYFSEEVDWLIPEWYPARSIAFLVSPPAHFKTMLTFDLAISVAGGWPFLGQFPVQNPGPVLVIQQEDDYGDMARRFSRIFAARQPGGPTGGGGGDDIVDEHLAVSQLPPVHIVTERGFTLGIENLRRLEDKIRAIRPRVIVIDPLYSITSADDFMMRAAKDMMPLKRLRDAYDCGFLIAAHTKKGADLGREGLWGSQFLNAFLETGWQIRGRPDGEWNQIQLLRHFKASGQLPTINMEFLLDESEGYKIALSDPEEEDQPQDAVMRTLAECPTGLSTKEIAERSGLSQKTVQRRLKKFQKAGLVVVCPAGYKIPKDTTEQ